MSIDYTTRIFTMSDFNDLTALFSREFSQTDRLLSQTYTQWLYIENPFGPARIVTAVKEGAWVGFLAMMPVILARRQGPRLAYYVVNVLVDNTHRGQNIFGEMIGIAAGQARSEEALLVGHPNEAAYGAWRRAGMHFQEPLRLRFVWGDCAQSCGLTLDEIVDGPEFSRLIEAYNKETESTSKFRIILSSQYINWRYRAHPTTRYRVRLLCESGKPVGLIATKRLRPAIHLWLDQFTLGDFESDGVGMAPWLTLAFATEGYVTSHPRLWTAPWKKEIPFFCTDVQRPLDRGDTERLGLSITDF